MFERDEWHYYQCYRVGVYWLWSEETREAGQGCCAEKPDQCSQGNICYNKFLGYSTIRFYTFLKVSWYNFVSSTISAQMILSVRGLFIFIWLTDFQEG